MEVLVIALGLSTLMAIGGAMLSEGARHRAVAALAGAAFGVFGVAGLLGALLLVVVPAYRRALARRGGRRSVARRRARARPTRDARRA
ncbi:MAG: hypothetical protein F4Z08_11515 [Chloroflexi bacterium]|nr:hypothetical protein [Chloroflexota bacterium]